MKRDITKTFAASAMNGTSDTLALVRFKRDWKSKKAEIRNEIINSLKIKSLTFVQILNIVKVFKFVNDQDGIDQLFKIALKINKPVSLNGDCSLRALFSLRFKSKQYQEFICRCVNNYASVGVEYWEYHDIARTLHYVDDLTSIKKSKIKHLVSQTTYDAVTLRKSLTLIARSGNCNDKDLYKTAFRKANYMSEKQIVRAISSLTSEEAVKMSFVSLLDSPYKNRITKIGSKLAVKHPMIRKLMVMT